MTDNHIFSKLREPLHETTRKVRRNLLVASTVGVIVTKVGLVPPKISTFGVEFSYSNQQALLIFLAIVIVYFLFSFAVYICSELYAWQVLSSSKDFEEVKEKIENVDCVIFGTVGSERIETQTKFLSQKTKSIFSFRLLIEIGIPVIFAIYSCYSLITMEPYQEAKPTCSVQESPANN